MIVLFVSFLTAVKQKADVEKEAKVSILEAGVTDVSTQLWQFESKSQRIPLN